MQFIRIKEWDKFQHYKDRSPPWIKLHKSMMTSRTWVSLDDAGRVLAFACMMLAADTDNKTPLDPVYLRRVAYLNCDPDFGPLVEIGFIEIIDEKANLLADASAALAKRTECSPEERREEKRTTLSGKPDGSAMKVLDHLNATCGTHYRPVPATLTLIRARLAEHGEPALLGVIDSKAKEWRGTDQAKYLRPETLFNATKCGSYAGQLNGAVTAPKGPVW